MNIEEMIKEYSRQLMKMKDESKFPQTKENENTGEAAEPEEEVFSENAEVTEYEIIAEKDETATESAGTEDIPDIEDTSFFREITDKTPSFSLKDSENFALFSANVFAGDNTYPVENAKVSVYRDDEIFAFLSTDENGLTKKVKLPSYPEINSLESENQRQSLDYYADVFANGFATQKGLLVSAVGGSDIVLDVSMTPLSDEVN